MTDAEVLAVLVLLILIFAAYLLGYQDGLRVGRIEGRRDERRRSAKLRAEAIWKLYHALPAPKRKEGELSTTPPNATSHESTS